MRFFDPVKTVLDVASTLAVIVVAGIVIRTQLFGNSGVARPPAAVPARGTINAALVTHVQGRGRIAIVEFSDFQCPFCGAHARDTLPDIKRNLIDPGTVRYVAMHFPLESIHAEALKAAEAAECAGKQGRFWEMYDRLFAKQTELAPADLIGHAKAMHLDETPFKWCLESGEMVDKARADRAEGRRLGVTVTPSFFLGTMRDDGGIDVVKRINGSTMPETFKSEVEELTQRQALRH
jgi:protein-disulfide isomerase